MKETVVGSFFRDTVCGDGICDFPEEFQGFGRFVSVLCIVKSFPKVSAGAKSAYSWVRGMLGMTLTPRNPQGCSQDCNPWRNVTKIDINLKDMIASSNGLPLAHLSDGSIVSWDFTGI
jgi:hypothetical protein